MKIVGRCSCGENFVEFSGCLDLKVGGFEGEQG